MGQGLSADPLKGIPQGQVAQLIVREPEARSLRPKELAMELEMRPSVLQAAYSSLLAWSLRAVRMWLWSTPVPGTRAWRPTIFS